MAWADGVLKDAERRSLEGILAAADLTASEKAEVRIYAATPRTLVDLNQLDIAAFAPGERRTALIHAVAIAFSDREYEHAERQTVVALAQRLGLAPAEAHHIIANAMMRAGALADCASRPRASRPRWQNPGSQVASYSLGELVQEGVDAHRRSVGVEGAEGGAADVKIGVGEGDRGAAIDQRVPQLAQPAGRAIGRELHQEHVLRPGQRLSREGAARRADDVDLAVGDDQRLEAIGRAGADLADELTHAIGAIGGEQGILTAHLYLASDGTAGPAGGIDAAGRVATTAVGASLPTLPS